MAVEQLRLPDTGIATTATPEPAVVCVCVFARGGDPFANEPDFQGLSSNLY